MVYCSIITTRVHSALQAHTLTAQADPRPIIESLSPTTYLLRFLLGSRREDVVNDRVQEDTADADGTPKQLDGVKRLSQHLPSYRVDQLIKCWLRTRVPLQATVTICQFALAVGGMLLVY